MTPLPPVSGVAKVQVLWDVGTDSDVSTTTYWRYSGGSFDSAAAAAMAGDILTNWAGHEGLWTPTVKLVGCRVLDLASDTAGEAVASTDVAGTRTGGPLPAATCAVANYTIDRRYRGGKPKGFLPWGSDSDLETEQTWTSAFITAALAAWQAFFAAVSGVSSGGSTLTTHVSVSYYSGFTVVTSPTTGRARNVPTKRTTPQVDTVGDTEIGTVLGSQRRRNRG